MLLLLRFLGLFPNLRISVKLTFRYLVFKEQSFGIILPAWQRPTLPGHYPSTIGAEELNFRVRDGNGCDLFAIITRHRNYSRNE